MCRFLISLCIAISLLLFPLPQSWSMGWRAEMLDRLHSPLFGLLGIMAPGDSIWRKLLLTCLVAATVEWLQPILGRSASMVDFLWGVIGASATSFWHKPSKFLRGVAMLTACAPPAVWSAQVIYAQSEATAQFPTLLSRRPSILWILSPGASMTSEGITMENACSIRTKPTITDWRTYEAIEIHGSLESIFPVELGIRLDDSSREGRRIHTAVVLHPGLNKCRIPWPKETFLSSIGQIVFFLPAQAHSARITFHQIQLVKRH